MNPPRNESALGKGRRMPVGLLTMLAGLLVWGATATGEPPPATNLTLAVAVALAVRDNAELGSLRARWEALQARPVQAKALPNPMLTYSGEDAADGGEWPDTGEKRVALQQDFPWFGKRALREDIAIKEAEATGYDLESLTRDVVMRVKEAYFELHAVQKAILVTRSDEGVLQRMEKIAETMYATGERPQQDVLKAQSEVTMLKQRLLELEAQEGALQARLNTLLNRRADTPWGAAVTSPDTALDRAPEQLFALAAAHRSEIRSAQAQTERYELEGRLMAKESLPDYQLGVEYRNLSGGADMVMFTVGVELPFRQSKNRAGVREAERMRASSAASRTLAERNRDLDVQDAFLKFQASRRMLTLYTAELVPQAETRFHASESDYQTGKADFLDFLESQRFLLGVRVLAAMAEGNVGMQLARLERAVGTELSETATLEGITP